ncbi:MAG: ATP phosphoribosyltransferase [Methanobacteriaceae archaeon]
MNLRIAIPSKGRISTPAAEILDKAGIGIKDPANRKLFSDTHNPSIGVMFARAADIPEFVADGIVDMGITGLDLVKENNADVEILTDLKFGKTSLVLATPEESDINSVRDVKDGMSVATEFPSLVKRYFEEKEIDVKIVELSGSTEIAPFIGLADIIADLTSTGTTLKMNHLKVIETIIDSSVILIANKKSCSAKKELIDSVDTSIAGVIEAEKKKLIMMNVKEADLQDVKELMPAMTGPTVSQVLSKETESDANSGIVAVQAVVDRSDVFELVNKLKNAGAFDILVVSIERII